jgi:hypothetical protein
LIDLKKKGGLKLEQAYRLTLNGRRGSNRSVEKIAQRGTSQFLLFTICYLGDPIKDDEMGRT